MPRTVIFICRVSSSASPAAMMGLAIVAATVKVTAMVQAATIDPSRSQTRPQPAILAQAADHFVN